MIKLYVAYLCQNSLPPLQEHIKKLLWSVRSELKECEAGPPEDPEGAKEFLIEVGPQDIKSSYSENYYQGPICWNPTRANAPKHFLNKICI